MNEINDDIKLQAAKNVASDFAKIIQMPDISQYSDEEILAQFDKLFYGTEQDFISVRIRKMLADEVNHLLSKAS